MCILRRILANLSSCDDDIRSYLIRKDSLEQIHPLLHKFHKVQDVNSIDTFVILVSNLMNKSENHRMTISGTGLIDDLIVTAQSYQQDRMLSESLIWMYSCLLSPTVHLNPSLQEQILEWSAEVYYRHPNETVFEELLWSTCGFLKREDASQKRVQLIMNLKIDEAFWETALHGQIGMKSITMSCRLLCTLIHMKNYTSQHFSLTSFSKILDQVNRRMPFDELTDHKMADERTTFLYLINQMLSSPLSSDAYFLWILQRMDILVKITELSTHSPELRLALQIITQIISQLHDNHELELVLMVQKHIFRAVLCKLDESNDHGPQVTLEALKCMESLLEAGARFHSRAGTHLDVEYQDGQSPDADNPVKNIFVTYAEIDYLEKLQNSNHKDVANQAIYIVEQYF